MKIKRSLLEQLVRNSFWGHVSSGLTSSSHVECWETGGRRRFTTSVLFYNQRSSVSLVPDLNVFSSSSLQSHLQTGMQPLPWDLQRSRRMQVSQPLRFSGFSLVFAIRLPAVLLWHRRSASCHSWPDGFIFTLRKTFSLACIFLCCHSCLYVKLWPLSPVLPPILNRTAQLTHDHEVLCVWNLGNKRFIQHLNSFGFSTAGGKV